VTVTEQATLWLSVVDARGRRLQLTQRGSRVGGVVTGPQAKTIRYRVLVPRALDLRLRIPAHLLRRGATYRVRVVAADPSGNRTTTFITFRP
jgi:hypothetical protein